MPRTRTPTLWIFEDQLSASLPALHQAPTDSPVLLIESRRNFARLPYHKKRLTFLISAMRHFAEELRESGRKVAYFPLRKQGYLDSLSAIRRHVRDTGSRVFWVVEPSEYHTRAWLETLPEKLNIEIRFFPNTLFLTDRDEFSQWAGSVRSPVMEFFYRRMRARHGVLMDGGKPAGGQWNFDTDNRKSRPDPLLIPPLPRFAPDEITRSAMMDVDFHFSEHYGSTQGFDLPVQRRDAEAFFADFVSKRLPLFGDYEDAMMQGQPHLFHSVISPLLNVGLLDPLACVRAAENAYRDGKAPLNSVEGFIRQILGWREYVYGIYWTFMPEYQTRNTSENIRPLPSFLWSGETSMNCLRQTITDLLESGYSHHIQRLMILCNFATLAGLSPQAVNDWFLTMYVDSHDWVVTPNVIGMGMHADGGTMATKPYVSSAAYINRMSDYCQNCPHNPRKRTGEDACPFNFLYWQFLERQQTQLRKNPRMTMMLKQLDRISSDERRAMRQASVEFLNRMKNGL